MKRSDSMAMTRERLLAAAERTFIRTRFSASTLQVARDAGVAHGTVFFHFKNRHDLIYAVARNLIGRITDALYRAYREAGSLRGYLTAHVRVIRNEWAPLQALWAGFPGFQPGTKQEIIALMSVMNYYTVEAFTTWADHGLARTYLWQGALSYLSIFGDQMFGRSGFAASALEEIIGLIARAEATAPRAARKPLVKEMCRSCATVLHGDHDHARGDPLIPYCRWCTDEHGSLKPFPEVIKVMTEFFQKTQGLQARAARQAGYAVLARNPAWREHLSRSHPESSGNKEV